MDMKFEKVADDWLKYKKPSIKTSTYSNYYGVVKNRLFKTLKEKSIKQLLKYDFNEYVMYLINKGLSSKTIRDTIRILKEILRYTEMKYGINFNIGFINVPKLKNNEVEIFNDREYKKIKDYLLKSNNHKHLGILLGALARNESWRSVWLDLE